MSEHSHPNYVKVWAALVVLLAISVIGPLFGHLWLTLATAFGVALVKAYLVARNFMHIHIEQRFIPYLVSICVVLMFLFFAGTAPDVMKARGENWQKPAWLAAEAAPSPTARAPDGGGHRAE